MRNGKTTHILTLFAGALLMVSSSLATDSLSVTRQVSKQLQADPIMNDHRIKVQVRNGVAHLTGSVDNLMAKSRATELALLDRRVDSVVNNINVQPRWTNPKQVERNLHKALRREKGINLKDVDAQVATDGKAFLVGTVDTFGESRMAEKIALAVSGVTGVTNGISVRNKTQRSASDMKKEIESNLYWNRFVSPDTVSLQVTGKQAILSGTVNSDFVKQQAIQAARVPGINKVNSLALRITPNKSRVHRQLASYTIPQDRDIKHAIEKALMIDPYVVQSMIDVEVERGVVTLSGQVDNARASAAAYRDASNTRGVVTVHNDIVVIEAPTMAKYY